MISYSFSIFELEFYLLILTRVSCFIFIAPFFSMNQTPARVRVVLSVFVSILLYYSVPNHEIPAYETLLAYAVLVMKEVLTGLLIGFSANLCMSVCSLAGHIIDMDIGLSMVSLFDPASREQVTITGALYQYVFTLMLICSGMYRYLLVALSDTFTLIPVAGAVFHMDALLMALIRFMGDLVVIGFRIALPIFVVILLLNTLLGIMAKVAPQMNMFAVGMQIKILVGLMVIYITVGMLPAASNFIFEEMKRMIVLFVEGVTP